MFDSQRQLQQSSLIQWQNSILYNNLPQNENNIVLASMENKNILPQHLILPINQETKWQNKRVFSKDTIINHIDGHKGLDISFFSSPAFIDKSLFIQSIVKSARKCHLITRPEGWGKRTNFQMLKTYLEQNLDRTGKKDQLIEVRIRNIFSKLKIWKENVHSIFRKVPVIYLDFQNIKGRECSTILTEILFEMVRCFNDHPYLGLFQDSEQSRESNHSTLLKLLENMASSNNIGVQQLSSCVSLFSGLLSTYHQKKIYVIINSYDYPINYSIQPSRDVSQLINKVNNFMKTIVNNFMVDKKVAKVVINGVFDTIIKDVDTDPILREIVSDDIVYGQYSSYFGFNSNDVQSLIVKWFPHHKDKQQKYFQSITMSCGPYLAKNMINYHPSRVIQNLDSTFSPRKTINILRQPANIYYRMIIKLFHSQLTTSMHQRLTCLKNGFEKIFRFNSKISLVKQYMNRSEELMVYCLLHTGIITMTQHIEKYATFQFRLCNKRMLQDILEQATPSNCPKNQNQHYQNNMFENKYLLNCEMPFTDDEESEEMPIGQRPSKLKQEFENRICMVFKDVAKKLRSIRSKERGNHFPLTLSTSKTQLKRRRKQRKSMRKYPYQQQTRANTIEND